jgi:hypothetical protein
MGASDSIQDTLFGLLPEPLGDVARRTRDRSRELRAKSPYAPELPTQLYIAGQQQMARGLAPTLSAVAGSLAEQPHGGGLPGGLYQPIPTMLQAPRWMTDATGNRTAPLRASYGEKGPVLVPREPWGMNNRARPKRVIGPAFLRTNERTPTAAEINRAYVERHQGRLRLQDIWTEADE